MGHFEALCSEGNYKGRYRFSMTPLVICAKWCGRRRRGAARRHPIHCGEAAADHIVRSQETALNHEQYYLPNMFVTEPHVLQITHRQYLSQISYFKGLWQNFCIRGIFQRYGLSSPFVLLHNYVDRHNMFIRVIN